MPDPLNPKPGEVWERDGRCRVVLRTYLGHIEYRIGKRTHYPWLHVWCAWARKATCIEEADHA